jgi:dTDP-glucose 4,6-dehydratase
MKTAVVTGGAGFLGSHLTDRLLAEGFRVVGVDNFITGNKANLDHLKTNPNYSFQEQDVSKHFEVPGEVNFIFHFASPASPIDYLELPIQTLKVGSLGTHNALGLAKAKGAGLLLASTFIRRPRSTGATSIPSGRVASMTKPSVSPRR